MSGIKWLLDTNVVIGLLKQQTATIALIESHPFDLSQAAVSQITRMELLGFPGLVQEEEFAILDLLQNCRILFIDEAIEQKTIQLRRASHCKLPDAVIAATALVHDLMLLTLDQRLQNLVAQFKAGWHRY
jgi:predicted nucleic acid-binding protein